MSDALRITIYDGKYTIIQAPTGRTRVLRYGEEWRDVTGDHVIGGLALELQEARERIKRTESFINRFLDPEDLGYVVNNCVRDDAREALGHERVEANP